MSERAAIQLSGASLGLPGLRGTFSIGAEFSGPLPKLDAELARSGTRASDCVQIIVSLKCFRRDDLAVLIEVIKPIQLHIRLPPESDDCFDSWNELRRQIKSDLPNPKQSS